MVKSNNIYELSFIKDDEIKEHTLATVSPDSARA